MSANAVAPEAVVSESMRWSHPEEAIESFLLDRPRMAWVREFSYYFTRLLSTIVHRHEVFPVEAAPLFLLDFDVVFEYLSVKGNVSPRSLAVEAFFRSTEFPFAIPLGSFLELLNWLNRAYLHLRPAERNYTPEETLDLLAQRLSARYGSQANREAAERAIQENVDNDIVQVSRLLELLQSPRFQGIWGVFSESDRQSVLPYVRTILRHDERQKDDLAANIPATLRKERRDQNDALNLAVTCCAATSGTHDAVLLMTNTKPLVELPDHFGIGHPDFESFQHKMDALLRLEGKPVAQHYPVVSPFDVWVWQLMRLYAPPHNPHTLLISTRQAFNNLTDALDEAMAENLDPATSTKVRERARDALSILAKQATDSGSPIGPFLQFSLSEIAVRDGRSLFALKHRDTLAGDDGADKYLALARLLQQLGVLLETERDRVFRYEVSPLPPYRGSQKPGFRFTIYFGKSREHGLTVADGELYAYASGDQLCVIRWPVICRVETFLRAVRSVLTHRQLRPREFRSKYEVPKFVRVGPDSSLWHSGVIAYTSLGAWGTQLSLAFRPGTWTALLERFRDGSLYSLVDEAEIDFAGNMGDLPEILSLRVNSTIGDFIYDIVPTDEDNSQFITYLSHAPQISDVIKLMARTSSSVVLEKDLAASLEKVFAWPS